MEPLTTRPTEEYQYFEETTSTSDSKEQSPSVNNLPPLNSSYQGTGSIPQIKPPVDEETENDESETVVSTGSRPEITSAFTRVIEEVVKTRYLNLIYWFECELNEKLPDGFWNKITRKLRDGKVIQVTRKYFEPQFPNKRRVYRIAKTSYSKQYLAWWEDAKNRYTEADFEKVYEDIKDGNFELFLDQYYPEDSIPEPDRGRFISERFHFGHIDSSDEDYDKLILSDSSETEEDSEEKALNIRVSSDERKEESTDQEQSQKNKEIVPQQKQTQIVYPLPEYPQIPLVPFPPPPKTVVLSVNNLFPPPETSSGFKTPPIIEPDYDADNSGDSPEKNPEQRRKPILISPKLSPTFQSTESPPILPQTPETPIVKQKPPITQKPILIKISTETMGSNDSSSSKNPKGKAHITYKNEVRDNGVYIVVSEIQPTDTYFTVNQMPFYRSNEDADEWTTPHNTNWIFKEKEGGFEIPMEMFLNPLYTSGEYKLAQEKRFKGIQAEVRKFEDKPIVEWEEDQKNLFTEYTKLQQQRLSTMLEMVKAKQETGNTIIERQKKTGWLERTLGDPFRNEVWAAPDPNERLVFGDADEATDVSTTLPPPDTGNEGDDKFLQIMDTIISRIKPTEYRVANYPPFNGTQDPYEWLIKFESACSINQIRNGRKLEILNGCLEGPAQAWWRANKHQIKRFGGLNDPTLDKRESFKFWFLNQYCGPDKQYQWTRELRNLKQQPGETVDSYASKLNNLYFRADPAKNYPGYDKMNQFVEGLRKEIRMEVRKSNPSELRDAIRIAKNVEIAYSDGGPIGAYSLTQHDAGIKQDLELIKVLLTKPETTEKCNLCYGGNHKTEDCPQRSINRSNLATSNNTGKNQLDKNTCYACNKPGHMKRNCPNTCQNCGKVGHRAPDCRQRNNNNYQPRVVQRTQNGPLNQNRNYQNNQNYQNNRNNQGNQNNQNRTYNNNNQQNQNQNNQPKKVYVAQTEEDLAAQMAELTSAIKSLKA